MYIWGFKHVLKMFRIMQSVFLYNFIYGLGNIFPLPPLLEIYIGWVPAEYRHIYNRLLSGGLKLAPMILK